MMSQLQLEMRFTSKRSKAETMSKILSTYGSFRYII